jgi:hypothetical protein
LTGSEPKEGNWHTFCGVERCDECGFVYDPREASHAGEAIVESAGELATLIIRSGSDARRRPTPERWSPVEYGCHVRDLLLVQRERLLLARRVERPTTESMGRDERAEHDGYNEQDPTIVARQLSDAALMFANVLSRLDANDWQRTLIYPYPIPTEHSLQWLAVHTLHEAQHHRLDVENQLS